MVSNSRSGSLVHRSMFQVSHTAVSHRLCSVTTAKCAHLLARLARHRLALQPMPCSRISPAVSTRLRGASETVEAGVAAWGELPMLLQGSLRLVRSSAVCCACTFGSSRH